jgi:ubiquinone/menaquinone biosynthesis C-methylase UbiE
MKNSVICNPVALAPAAMAQPAPDFAVIKTRQQKMWSSGDFAVVGTTLQIVGEELCEALDVRSGQRVLDVAAGNGNAALAAARRWCDVTATDYVPELLEGARARAAAGGLVIKTEVADAESLPFADESFDVVTSTFGVMFTPEHERPARSMLRVCRRGGKIGMANWTPEGFIGQLFKTVGRFVPPAPGTRSPALWGSRAHVLDLFGLQHAQTCKTEARNFMMRYRSDEHWIEIFRSYYGPVLKAFEALDAQGQRQLHADIKALIARFNVAQDGTMVVPSEYLQIVITKR